MKFLVILAIYMSSSLAFSQSFGESKPLQWMIKRLEWTGADEKNFQEFVRLIGEGRENKLCLTTYDCIKNPKVNKFFAKLNPPGLKFFSDCADLPYILRAYFAWMNDLPFVYPIDVDKFDPIQDAQTDIRYTKFGNKISKLRAVKTGMLFSDIVVDILDSVQSGMFRIHPRLDVYDNVFSDLFSTKISREAIVPGTIVYDPAGHVLVVYRVEKDGRIQAIDAHPDDSLTRKTYGEQFARSRPAAGAGFKYFRPIKLIGATLDSEGNYIGGNIVPLKNKEIVQFGLEQYYGNEPTTLSSEAMDANWSKGKFLFNNSIVGYYDYVRLRLAIGNVTFDPVVEFKNSLQSICNEFADRIQSVDKAFLSGIPFKIHPERLPENIFGTTGEWESFSTPSRDARLKAILRETVKSLKINYQRFMSGDPLVQFTGSNLLEELKNAYSKSIKSCSLNYRNSKNTAINLNLHQLIERIYLMSFDPYHCPELRFGATGNELVSCPLDPIKMEWYSKQQYLRNMIDRNYEMKMDLLLSEMPGNLGVRVSEDLSIQNALKSL